MIVPSVLIPKYQNNILSYHFSQPNGLFIS